MFVKYVASLFFYSSFSSAEQSEQKKEEREGGCRRKVQPLEFVFMGFSKAPVR